MDPDYPGGKTGSWTNEKHFHFLNSIEDSFVRSMLRNHHHLLPLDPPSPATAESTADSKQQIGKPEISRPTIIDRDENFTRRRSSSTHPGHDHTQDQVVPSLDNKSK